jgi:hypothetical protein
MVVKKPFNGPFFRKVKGAFKKRVILVAKKRRLSDNIHGG